MSDAVEDFYDYFELFELEFDPKEKTIIRSLVIESFGKINTPESNDYHALGIVYYMSDDQKEKNRQLAFDNFMKAYEIDPGNFLACLYIAHCHHDKKELDLALKYYQLVDKKALEQFQEWRYIKLIEQIGFCHHQLGAPEKARELFEWVLKRYQQATDAQGYNELPLPIEMTQCLKADDEIMAEMKKLNQLY